VNTLKKTYTLVSETELKMAAGIFSAKDASHISKFKGDQFNLNKFQLRLVLMNRGLLNIVEGVYKKPTVVAPIADPSNAAVVTANTAEINEWKKMDIAAQNFIVSTVEEKVMRTIMNCTTSNLMWTRLLNQYELASMENKHLFMGKFVSY
jgi:gag-polypeptide of LTR copia-type